MKGVRLSSDFSTKNLMTSRLTDKSECRFSIVKHEMPANSSRPSHFDLFLEHAGKLLTWELPMSMSLSKSGAVNHQLARRLPDHRLIYLDFEGPVSGDRGSVALVAAGRLQWLEMESDGLIARTYSDLWTGILTLRPIVQSDSDQWRLDFEPDESRQQSLLD
jgi:DNA polymerase Ligase (LigD)